MVGPGRLIFLSVLIKVCSLFKDSKQTAGCTEFSTETGLSSLASEQKFVHPAVCLPSLKKRTDFNEKYLHSVWNVPRLRNIHLTIFDENSLNHTLSLIIQIPSG